MRVYEFVVGEYYFFEMTVVKCVDGTPQDSGCFCGEIVISPFYPIGTVKNNFLKSCYKHSNYTPKL